MAKQRAPRNPLPSGYVPPGGVSHDVFSGDSLASVARANGMTEDELNLFNFNTTDPEEINWYLQHRVGCTAETTDHLNWMFTTRRPKPLFIYLPAAKKKVVPPSAGTTPTIGPGRPEAAPVPATLAVPDAEVKYEIPLPQTPWIGNPSMPFLVCISGKIVAKGVVKADGSHSKISGTVGKAEVEMKFKQSFGEVKLKAGLKPGEITKVGLEWTPNSIPIGIELDANADFTKPFTVSGKWKEAIKVVDFKIGDHLKFAGTIDPQIDFHFAPNPAFIGWQALGRVAVRGVQTGANAVRGIFIAEEAGTLTGVGVAAVATVIAAAYIGWVAFGLYQVGKAARTGRILAVRYAFSGGYASALAGFTSDVCTFRQDEVQRWLSIDWKTTLTKFTSIYVDGSPTGEVVYPPDMETTGKAAIAQDLDYFIRTNGYAAWDKVKKKHQTLYGSSYMDRRSRYFNMLKQQIDSGRDTLGIQILQ